MEKNEILLQIDPSDYKNTLELRKSEFLQTQTNLNIEMGRQQVAQQDLELIGGDSLSSNEKSLVLREPQLDAVKATVKATRASVDQAELNLRRTTIRAPFDAHVLSQNVTKGSQVSPGDNLGRLVGTDYYWVVAAIPVAKLQWISFPGKGKEQGSMVKLVNRSAWPHDVYREGYVFGEVGALDAQTRLAQVLVRVEDPLVHKTTDTDMPKLMIGSFVDAHIQAKEITDVVRLHRDYVRSNQTVWVMEEGKLAIREVQIILSDSEYAYIKEGLSDQDLVVTTNLSTVAEGLGLRRDTASNTEGGTDNSEVQE